MASYPGSVKTFTTKNTGDVVQASHINDAQDEINAMEAGLLNGTARLNSSNSTVATLSVTGGSTFSVRSIEPPPHMAVIYLASTATIGSSADSTLTWLAQSIVTNSSMHSTGTTPERLTPQSTGIYYCAAQVMFSANSSGSRSLRIDDSSGAIVGTLGPMNANTDDMRLQTAGYKHFDALGGYITCRIGSSAQSTLSLSSGSENSWFSLRKL